MKITSINDIQLDKPSDWDTRTQLERSWEQEVIYFLMVDRFHSGEELTLDHVSNAKTHEQERLMQRFGGTFSGIQKQLPYIKALGCTTIWLSPVCENYEPSYHGYATTNFLSTDPRFGTMKEFKLLVEEAHKYGIRILLDIVINHTANTWSYAEGQPKYTGTAYTFGKWKDDYFPLPRELRNPEYYRKAGAIEHWDEYPETREGDIFELKKLVLDSSPIGKEVLLAMVRIYCYWIRETNVDGFRLDTVKHLYPEVVANFCTQIRDYATYLGKQDFKILGEVVGDEKSIGAYWKSYHSGYTLERGIDKTLDFPMHFILPEIIKGERPLAHLYTNYLRKVKLLGKYHKDWSDLVVFLDNHDQIAQEYKRRIGYESEEKQIIAMVGFLYFIYGIPCLYYGTEQHFNGNGQHDSKIREPMFNREEKSSYHLFDSFLFKEIALLSRIRQELSLFLRAKLEIDEVSINNATFISCEKQNEVIYWSKRIFNNKLILAFNPKKDQKLSFRAKLSKIGPRIKNKFKYLYGGEGFVEIEVENDCGYINIDLNPLQFVILK